MTFFGLNPLVQQSPNQQSSLFSFLPGGATVWKFMLIIKKIILVSMIF